MTHQSDSAGLFDVPNTESRSFVPAGRAPMGAVTLGLAAVLALGAGEAAAQDPRVCSNPVPVLPIGTTEERLREISGILRQGAIAESPHVAIYCRYGRADRNDRGILVHNPQIVVVDDFAPGIEAFHEGVGDLSIFVHAISAERSRVGEDIHVSSLAFIHPSPADYGQGIFTTGNAEDYITGEDSYGIHARHTGEGQAGIDVRNVSVRTTGDYSHGVYAWQQGSYRLAEGGGSSDRAHGAVIVRLVETDRERDQRVRPLVATSGDYADAVRAEYTRAAARGHIAVTVEGYTLTTGGTVPEEALVSGVDAEEAIEVSTPRPPVYDPSKISIVNPNHDPLDPNSPEFINVVQRGDGSLATDLRPYTAVYIPVRNPDYDPEDSNSSPWSSGIALWNGRYFLGLGRITADYVNACQGEATADARRACYENKIVEDGGTNLPTGFGARGIYASHEGHGDIRIRATDNDISTRGEEAQGIYATHTGRTIVCGAPGSGCEAGGGTTPGGGGISIVVTRGATISTQGGGSHGVWARHRGDSGADAADGVDPGNIGNIGTGNVDIDVTNADIDTAGDHASGVYGLIQQTCTADTAEDCKKAENLVAGTGVGDIDIAVTGGYIDTAGVGGAYAVHARHENTGAIAVRLTGVAAATEGDQAHGVFADHSGSAGTVSVTVDGGSVATQGDDAHGVYGTHAGSGDLTVGVMDGAAVTTKGIGAQGVRADHDGSGTLTIDLAGDVTTEGESSEGVLALHRGSGALAIGMTGGAVETTGFEVHGLSASHTGAAGTVSVTVSGGSVTAEDANSAGVLAHHGADDREGAVTVTVGQGASVTGGLVGIQLIADADADGNIPTRTVNVDGTVRGVSSAGIHLPTGGTVNVGATGRVSGAAAGIFSNGDHDADVTVAGMVEGNIRAEGDGDLTATISGAVTGDILGHGAGDLTADVAGTVTGSILNEGGGTLTFSSQAGSTVTGTVHNPRSPTVHGSVGRLLYDNGGTVTVAGTGHITGVEVEGRKEAIRNEAGDLTATISGAVTGDILNRGSGALTFVSQAGSTVTGTVHGRGAGDLTADVAGTVTGDILNEGDGALSFTSQAGSTVTGTVHNPRSPTVHGSVGRLLYDNGGTVTVAGTGHITGVEVEGRKEAIRNEAGDLTATISGAVTGDILNRGSGALTADVAGTVTGDILNEGDGALTFTSQDGSTVTGTVHNPQSPLAVHGNVGRLLYANGGTVTVAGTGSLTGVEVEGRKEAVRNEAGDLMATISGAVTGDILNRGSGALTFTSQAGSTVTGNVHGRGAGDLTADVAGTVTGDILNEGGGVLTFASQAGSTVTGTVHNPQSPLAVHGSVGRLLYANGGTVTVAGTGRLTGIEGDAIRSEAGNLAVTVDRDGEVQGDVLAKGDGDLTATISGSVTGDVRGEGTGDHTVTVMNGGTVSGTIRLAASTVTVDGAAGRVWLDNGGTVTVGEETGLLTGVEVERDGVTVREAVRSDTGNLTATLAGKIMGDVLVRGTGMRQVTVAGGGEVQGDIRAEGDGDLMATISGAVTGDVLALGTGVHRVTVATDGDVEGIVRVATRTGRGETDSALTVNGAVGRVHLVRGGALTVGPNGRIRGIAGITISAGGDVELELQERPGEMTSEALARVQGPGRMIADNVMVLLRPADGSEPRRLGRVGPYGPYDMGLENGEFMEKVAPRARLYEALPSVMLGLNRLSEFRDRMAAPRDASGGWARVHGSRGKWKADNTWPKSVEPPGLKTSTVVESRWSGIQAGLDAPVGDGLFGISLHHRNGSATVSNASTIDVPGAGTMDLSGTGGGISGTWRRDDVYVDLQAEVSWYEADFRSSIRGMLKEDVSGYGYALGVEAGRRIASGTDGVAFIPRAGLVHSKVSLTDFDDAELAGKSRVSLEDGRSLKGRMGVSVDVETKLSADSESRFLYSLDVEREFKDETKVSMTKGDTRWDLASTVEATWLRAGMNVSHAWDDGRYTIQGGVSYATAGSDSHEYGGGLRLKVRF